MKKYAEFRYDNLPFPPASADERLIELFRPSKEPDIEAHYEEMKEFRQWLLQPLGSPGEFPDDASNIKTPLGRWVYRCASKWKDRYNEARMRAELGGECTKGFFTGALLAVLGAVGLDGDIEGTEEWLPPAFTLGGRVLFPVGFKASQERSKRNRDVMMEIEAKFYA